MRNTRVTALVVALVAACTVFAQQVATPSARKGQVDAITAPKAVVLKVDGKELTFTPLKIYSTVVRTNSKTDAALLANLPAKAVDAPEKLVDTAIGTVYVGSTDDLKGAAELQKLAADGKLPPIYQAYQHGNEVVILDGSTLVKPKDTKTAKQDLADFCTKHGLECAPTPNGDFIVSIGDAATITDSLSLYQSLVKEAFVEEVDPAVIIVTKKEPEKKTDPGQPAPMKKAD